MELRDLITYLIRYVVLFSFSVSIVVFVIKSVRDDLYENTIRNRHRITDFLRYKSLTFNLFQNKNGYVLLFISIFLITPSIVILIMYIIDKLRISYMVCNYYK